MALAFIRDGAWWIGYVTESGYERHRTACTSAEAARALAERMQSPAFRASILPTVEKFIAGQWRK